MNTMQHLRSLIHATSGTRTQKDVITCASFKVDIPRGAISEISGHGKTEFLVQLLAQHATLKAAWIGYKLSVYPCGFFQRGINPSQVLFVESGHNTCWATLQILRSGLFAIAVLDNLYTKDNILRRHQLAAEKSNTSLILLSDTPQHQTWLIHCRIHVIQKRLGQPLHIQTWKRCS